ncbi:hypothetical protein ACVW0W_002786 [Bradyrhizobium sp. USDA 4469]
MRSGEKFASKKLFAAASSVGSRDLSSDLAARQGSISEPAKAFGSGGAVCALIEWQLARKVL